MLHSPYSSPESILLMGSYGVGKTSAYLSIARLAHLTGSPAHFYVLDTDHAVKSMLERSGNKLPNMTITEAQEFPDFLDWVRGLSPAPCDWVICDFIDEAWNLVQRYFTEEIFRQDMGEYFLQARKSLKSGGKFLQAFQGWTDWNVINALYFDFFSRFIRLPCHRLAVAKVAEVTEDEKSRERRDTYGALGVRPTGQKALGYPFQTLLLLTRITTRVGKEVTGTYMLTSVKDRERELLSDRVYSNFARDYLVEVAKWELVSEEVSDA